jgi:hypothetical protein
MGNKISLPNSPTIASSNLVSEKNEMLRLADLFPRSTSGNIIFNAPISGQTYNTATFGGGAFQNQGQQGMLLLLQDVLKDYNWTAADANNKVDHTLATAENDFLVGNTGGGSWIKKTLAEVRTILSCLLTSGGNVSGEINMQDNLLTRPKIKDYSEAIGTTPATTGIVTLDLTTGNTFDVTPTGAIIIAVTNPPVSGDVGSFTLYIKNSATVYSKTFPASFKFDNDVIPDMSTPNKTIILSGVTKNGGTTYHVGAFGTKFTT